MDKQDQLYIDEFRDWMAQRIIGLSLTKSDIEFSERNIDLIQENMRLNERQFNIQAERINLAVKEFNDWAEGKNIENRFETVEIFNEEECTPLLSIVLDDINSVPVVHYKGEEITMKQRVSFDWETRREVVDFDKLTYIAIEHQDKETKDFNTKTIQHNKPFVETIKGELITCEGIGTTLKTLSDYSLDELIKEIEKREDVNIYRPDEWTHTSVVDHFVAKKYSVIVNQTDINKASQSRYTNGLGEAQYE